VLEFFIYVRYISHDDTALSYMEDAFRPSHNFKDSILLMCTANKAITKVNTLRTELVKKYTVDNETNGKTWTLSKKWRIMNNWQDYISYEINVSKELDGTVTIRRST
jgi:hypothetical protein